MSSPSLDYNKHNRNSVCGAGAAVGRVQHGNVWVFAVARLLCKSWACVVCGPKKAYRLRQSIVWWVREHELSRFLTLTLDPRKIPVGTSAERYIRHVWSKFRVYLGRLAGEAIEFISILEHHKSGIPHLHVLINRYIPQHWISKTWSGLGGGKIVYIKKVVDIGNVGQYLSKYLTKDMILSAPRGVRRYTTSRGIKLWKHYVHSGQTNLFDWKEESKWRTAPGAIEDYYAAVGTNVLTERMGEDGAIMYFTTPVNVEEEYEKSRHVLARF